MEDNQKLQVHFIVDVSDLELIKKAAQKKRLLVSAFCRNLVVLESEKILNS